MPHTKEYAGIEDPGSTPWVRLTFRHAKQLAAPHTWAASLCPALFGIFYCLLTGKTLHPLQAVGLVAACVLMQSAVNTFNDLMDYKKGTDSRSDYVEESDATLVYEHLNPRHVFYLAGGYLIGGAILGILCSMHILPVLIGLVGGIVVLIYSAGPLPLSHYPVGEAVSGFVMGGLIPFGIAAAADGQAHWDALLCSLPLMISIALIMMSNNGSDIEKDSAAGRRTLPVRIGRNRTVVLFRILTGIWIAMIAAGPILFLGWIGLISPALLLLFARRHIAYLITCTLQPENRILQMKHIAKGNLLGNGACIAAMAAAWLISIPGR